MMIKDGHGKPMLAIDVYTAVINDLKQRALIHTDRNQIDKIHIAWVMTVPDVWNKNARDFIRLSCERVSCVLCNKVGSLIFLNQHSKAD